jgi:hypothetical protein
MASDVQRGGDMVKAAYQEVVEQMVKVFEDHLNERRARERALALVALCVGGMVLARNVGDPGLADDFRRAAHAEVLRTVSQAVYCLASFQLALITGMSPRPQRSATRGHPASATQASHSSNVTSNLETASGCASVTSCCGPSLVSRSDSFSGDPITNLPAGMMIINRAATRTFPELRTRPCRVCLLLLQRQHSRAGCCPPAMLPHDFLCDGTCINEAHVGKTEQDREAREQQPAALCLGRGRALAGDG